MKQESDQSFSKDFDFELNETCCSFLKGAPGSMCLMVLDEDKINENHGIWTWREMSYIGPMTGVTEEEWGSNDNAKALAKALT